MGLREYVQARQWAAQQNLNDIVDAIRLGRWEDIIHFLGADAQTALSLRMEKRRAWARKTILHPELLNHPPKLPPLSYTD